MNGMTQSTGFLNAQLVIALVVLKGCQQFDDGETVSLADLAGHVKTLKEKRCEVDILPLSHQSGRHYSQDIDKFLSESEVYGDLLYYKQQTIGFKPRLKKICLNGIKGQAERNPELWPIIENAHRTLDIRYQTFY